MPNPIQWIKNRWLFLYGNAYTWAFQSQLLLPVYIDEIPIVIPIEIDQKYDLQWAKNASHLKSNINLYCESYQLPLKICNSIYMTIQRLEQPQHFSYLNMSTLSWSIVSPLNMAHRICNRIDLGNEKRSCDAACVYHLTKDFQETAMVISLRPSMMSEIFNSDNQNLMQLNHTDDQCTAISVSPAPLCDLKGNVSEHIQATEVSSHPKSIRNETCPTKSWFHLDSRSDQIARITSETITSHAYPVTESNFDAATSFTDGWMIALLLLLANFAVSTMSLVMTWWVKSSHKESMDKLVENNMELHRNIVEVSGSLQEALKLISLLREELASQTQSQTMQVKSIVESINEMQSMNYKSTLPLRSDDKNPSELLRRLKSSESNSINDSHEPKTSKFRLAATSMMALGWTSSGSHRRLVSDNAIKDPASVA